MKKIDLPALVIIGVMLVLGTYFIALMKINKTYTRVDVLPDEFVGESLGVNEYQVVNLTKEEILNLYFASFTTVMMENPSKAYLLLDDEYRRLYCPNLESFRAKIDNITDNYETIPVLDRYEIKEDNGLRIYTMSDKKGNIYTFKVEGAMKYTVSLQ